MKKTLWYFAGFMILSVFVSSIFSKHFPSEKEIDTALFKEPAQEISAQATKERDYKGVHYTITPKFSYELSGLVVSVNDNNVWYSRFKKQDPLNTKDFCVVWGDNLKDGLYKETKFRTEEFYCSATSRKALHTQQISNNHIIPANDKIYNIARKVGVGDQIKINGYLASYIAESENGKIDRDTSTVRGDTGNGACETIYTTDLQILKNTNQTWRIINLVSKYLLAVAILSAIFI